MIKNSSVFADSNELGISKSAFITKYGKHINKDIKNEGNNLIESLYYVKSIDEVLITTKIKFVNDRVVEQSNFKIEYNTDKRLKELNEELRRTKLRVFMNQN